MNEVNKVFYYSGIGKRNNNEDSYSFSKSNFFIVCDGVGGAEKGEVASSIVVNELTNIYNESLHTEPEQALRFVEKKLSEHINYHPESMGMATTLTFSKLTNEGILVAWVGDSRIYQFRNGKIIFQTTDHSWVNDALRAGMITAEEAVNHPKSNIITRAVQGEHKPVEIDIELISDLKDEDFIFQCSDGVLEAWNNEELETLFSSINDGDELLKSIESKCADISRDNNTAILYQIKSDNKPSNNQLVEPQEVFVEEVVEAIPIDENQYQNSEPKQNVEHFDSNPTPKSTKFKFNKFLFLGTILVFGFVIFFLMRTNDDKPKEKQDLKKAATKEIGNNTGPETSNVDKQKKDTAKVIDSKEKVEVEEEEKETQTTEENKKEDSKPKDNNPGEEKKVEEKNTKKKENP
jgi:serine/threonine protein phosphatase PrpC